MVSPKKSEKLCKKLPTKLHRHNVGCIEANHAHFDLRGRQIGFQEVGCRLAYSLNLLAAQCNRRPLCPSRPISTDYSDEIWLNRRNPYMTSPLSDRYLITGPTKAVLMLVRCRHVVFHCMFCERSYTTGELFSERTGNVGPEIGPDPTNSTESRVGLGCIYLWLGWVEIHLNCLNGAFMMAAVSHH